MREEWWPLALYALLLVWLLGFNRLEGKGGGLMILLQIWWQSVRKLLGW